MCRRVSLRAIVVLLALPWLAMCGVNRAAPPNPYAAQLIMDIAPGSEGSNPSELTPLNTMLFFTADDGAHGRELWKSDGTLAGTALVRDINPLPSPSIAAVRSGAAITGWSAPAELTPVRDLLLFTADDGAHGRELWASDGTTAGTRMVADLTPGEASAEPVLLTVVQDRVFFTADDGAHGRELWVSDGTMAGTRMVADLTPGAVGSGISELAALRDTLFFILRDPQRGDALWRSDGSAAGTILVRQFPPALSGAYALTRAGDRMFFVAPDPGTGHELWQTDGTPGGTVMVKDTNPGLGDGDLRDLVAVDGQLYFLAAGRSVWRSDGRGAGTFPIWRTDGAINSLTRLNGRLFFCVKARSGKGSQNEALWVSDGTPLGTAQVSAVSPSEQSLSAGPDVLLFTTIDAAGVALWQSDGTAAGTHPIAAIGTDLRGRPLPQIHGALIVAAVGDQSGAELWALR